MICRFTTIVKMAYKSVTEIICGCLFHCTYITKFQYLATQLVITVSRICNHFNTAITNTKFHTYVIFTKQVLHRICSLFLIVFYTNLVSNAFARRPVRRMLGIALHYQAIVCRWIVLYVHLAYYGHFPFTQWGNRRSVSRGVMRYWRYDGFGNVRANPVSRR